MSFKIVSKTFKKNFKDTKEWRQFIADQRLPNPENFSSRNRIQADSRLRIIHPKKNNDELKRPIIENLTNKNPLYSKSLFERNESSTPENVKKLF